MCVNGFDELILLWYLIVVCVCTKKPLLQSVVLNCVSLVGLMFL